MQVKALSCNPKFGPGYKVQKRERKGKELELKVALETLAGEKPVAQIASDYGVNPAQITRRCILRLRRAHLWV